MIIQLSPQLIYPFLGDFLFLVFKDGHAVSKLKRFFLKNTRMMRISEFPGHALQIDIDI